MRILLDESPPRPLARLLVGHQVRTVTPMRWTGLANGALLRQAATDGFDAMLTADQNLQFQQSLNDLPVSVIVLVAPANRIEFLEPLVPALLDALDTLRPHQLIRVGV